MVQNPGQRQYLFQGTNPWEREEREKEQLRRREAAKIWRDQQISELGALGANRTPSQEEQLRNLRLDKEFERRVEEQDDDEEDEQEELPYNAGGSVTGTNTNQRYSGGAPRPQHLRLDNTTQQQQLTNGPPAQQRLDSLVGNNNLPPEPPERVSSYAVMSSTLRSPVMSNEYHINTSHPINSTLNNINASHITMNSSHSTMNSSHNTMNSSHNTMNSSHNTMNSSHNTMNSSHNTLNSSHNTTNSSQLTMNSSHNTTMNSTHNTTHNASSHDSNNNPSSATTNATPSKRVSFQDTSSVSHSPPSPVLEKIREDPNSFIDEAENMLASPKTPDGHFAGTPSVIGTQEIYKDPRQRRLAQQQQEKMLSNKTSQVPEKLSFKEKMKMFAMETGEDGTPRDKVKISRAQRDIDNLGTPTSTNINTSNESASNVSVNNLNSKFKTSAAITSN
ncbi:uncharacterized protein DDB_G0283357-like [Diaphorina citri]|uniref:Uncharacterized protein DDB_G0283357-like n=1 Tax=Diaphorina citri TaxID=121845 RepID=A0A1S3CWI9_DIACI|nr:uncharacterized protein DDB_G0283357-like [Diaphorina citri]